MISRIEFYACFIILILIIGFSTYVSTYDPAGEAEKARLQARDSLLLVQRDSAFARALKKELIGDSLQAIVNRRNLDLNNIKKKYANEKKNVSVLGADSSLLFFQRSVTN